jgi:homoserine O-succinyltransferase/O-acetyltransferase
MTSLRIGLVDMNNGVANQAMRCFRRILDRFEQRVHRANPTLELMRHEMQPRNLGEVPSGHYDLILSTGGPGSPFDGLEEPWGVGYRKFLDDVFAHNQRDYEKAPKLLAVCHSFEIAVIHFGVATMTKRDSLRFGLMPAYTTTVGQEVDYFKPFADRLFTWEHRWWQAVEPNAERLRELGGRMTAHESRESGPNKGDAALAFKFAPGIDGTQFHPEADKPGVLAWVVIPEHAEKFKAQYGNELYERMIKSLNDPTRLARTFALFIPGWLTHRFNEIAAIRDLKALDAPELDVEEFGASSPSWSGRAA